MSARLRQSGVPLLLVLVLASGCGTTVQGAIPTATSGGADNALGTGSATGGILTGSGGSPADTATGGGPGSTSGGGAGAPADSSTGTGASSTGTATGGPLTDSTGAGVPGGAGESGPGVTAKEVYVGLVHDRNAGALNAAAGASGLTSGDSQADELAVIDDINKSGGVGGRKLVPVYAEIDSTSTQTLDQQYASVCQKFTLDKRVFVATGPGPESYLDCLSKVGVPILDDDLPVFGRAAFAKYPGFIEQGYPNVDRLAAYHVDPLVAQKYFTPWNTATGEPAAAGNVHVGVLTYNDKVFSGAVDSYLIPSLKKQGFDPVVVKVAKNSTASDISGQAAAVQSAQLTFASRGVTHVLIFEAKAELGQFFLANARSQRYYPRYGFNSANGPQALLSAGLLNAQQANGAVGYGWLPNLDLLPNLNPDNGPYSNDLRRRCAAVMKSHDISFDSSNAQGIGYIACSSLYLVKVALDRTPQQITQASFLNAVGALAATFQPAGGLGSRGQTFRPGRNDPQDKAYYMHFAADCGCFRYSGTLQTIP